MANEILQKSRPTLTAQGNGTALTATFDPNSGSYTGATPLVLDNTYDEGTENCRGSNVLQLELVVTTAPSTATGAQIWYRGSEDGTNYTKWKYSHAIGDTIGTAPGRYDGGSFLLEYQYTNLVVMAVSYGFSASLLCTPKLMEIQ